MTGAATGRRRPRGRRTGSPPGGAPGSLTRSIRSNSRGSPRPSRCSRLSRQRAPVEVQNADEAPGVVVDPHLRLMLVAEHRAAEPQVGRERDRVVPGAGRRLDRIDLRRVRRGGAEHLVEVGVAGLQVAAHDRHVVPRPGGAALLGDAHDLRVVLVEVPRDQRLADQAARLVGGQRPRRGPSRWRRTRSGTSRPGSRPSCPRFRSPARSRAARDAREAAGRTARRRSSRAGYRAVARADTRDVFLATVLHEKVS